MHNAPQDLMTAPPYCVTNRERVLQRFGSEGLVQLLQMASEGDPLAVVAIQELRQAPAEQRGSLEAGIHRPGMSIGAGVVQSKAKAGTRQQV